MVWAKRERRSEVRSGWSPRRATERKGMVVLGKAATVFTNWLREVGSVRARRVRRLMGSSTCVSGRRWQQTCSRWAVTSEAVRSARTPSRRSASTSRAKGKQKSWQTESTTTGRNSHP